MNIEVLKMDVENNQIVIEITEEGNYNISDLEIKKKFIKALEDHNLSQNLLFDVISFVICAEIIRK